MMMMMANGRTRRTRRRRRKRKRKKESIVMMMIMIVMIMMTINNNNNNNNNYNRKNNDEKKERKSNSKRVKVDQVIIQKNDNNDNNTDPSIIRIKANSSTSSNSSNSRSIKKKKKKKKSSKKEKDDEKLLFKKNKEEDETKKKKKNKEKEEVKIRKVPKATKVVVAHNNSSNSTSNSDDDIVDVNDQKDEHDNIAAINNSSTSTNTTTTNTTTLSYQLEDGGRPLVESSALPSLLLSATSNNFPIQGITLLLFYQYVEPMWNDNEYKDAMKYVEQMALTIGISGRMRIAKEGLNCTLTSNQMGMYEFIQNLRKWKPTIFLQTEFKLTHNLPEKQRFPILKIIPVLELVNYGLAGPKAPPISKYSGIHLEPMEYHKKLAEPDTVVIDVRNHYEAIIGHFDPPTILQQPTTDPDNNTNSDNANNTNETKSTTITTTTTTTSSSKYIDPKMRKSTEFPVWLTSESTKEKLRNKQVMMYCTGGIRCERASALLQYKIENDPTIAALNIKGVYQLQGGIDKYFKEFATDGGYWKGKNYVFDKRFAHTPTTTEKVSTRDRTNSTTSISSSNNDNDDDDDINNEDTVAETKISGTGTANKGTATTTTTTTTNTTTTNEQQPMSKCEACGKGWDMYRGKRRCPTCGVPSLICKDCWIADQKNIRKIDRSIRCDLCVEQKIFSKHKLISKIQSDIERYEQQSLQNGTLLPQQENDNPNNITRLYIKNMCRKRMTEEILTALLPGITHIVWRMDRIKKDLFLGSAWVEMKSSQYAADAVSKSGEIVLGRPIYIEYQPPDPKDVWPPPHNAIVVPSEN